jgi:hypothetical protein
MSSPRPAFSFRFRVLSITLAVILSTAAVVAGVSASSADAARQTASGVRFVVTYRGTLQGTWQMSSPVLLPGPNEPYRCQGDSSSGSLTSSVAPGSRPFIAIADNEFGHYLYLSTPTVQPRGLVTSNQSAQGFLLTYSGGQCVRKDMPEPGCGANTFAGSASPLSYDGGELMKNLNRLYLAWELTPPDTTGCDDMLEFDVRYMNPGGGAAAALDLKKLYRCGVRNPHGCTLTIHGQTRYAARHDEGPETFDSTYTIEWSATFKAAGRA